MTGRPSSSKVELDIRDIMAALNVDGEKFLKELASPSVRLQKDANPGHQQDGFTSNRSFMLPTLN